MTDLAPALPDAEQLLVAFLLAQDEIVDAIPHDDHVARVYTVLPEKPTWPLLRLTRVAGSPVVQRPLVLDNPIIQVEAYGGSKKQARDLIELVRSLVAERIDGVHETGVVTAYGFGSLAWLPDNSYEPSRARYVADVQLWVRPNFTAGS